MKAIEINQHFLSRADWAEPGKTVDKIIVGDPEKEIRRILVTWISSLDAVRLAIERGFDMIMTHEPTFYDHLDNIVQDESGIAAEKKRLIEKNGLVVLRNHDVWDLFPQIGIPWAWAQYLGLGEKPVSQGFRGFMHRYDIEPLTFREFARRVAAKTAPLGEPFVQTIGDGDQIVSRIGLGTGCIAWPHVLQDMGCDVSIVVDDGTSYWANLQRAADRRHAVIRVNHGTAEEPGMVTLTRYINENLPGITAEHLPHGSSFRLVGIE